MPTIVTAGRLFNRVRGRCEHGGIRAIYVSVCSFVHIDLHVLDGGEIVGVPAGAGANRSTTPYDERDYLTPMAAPMGGLSYKIKWTPALGCELFNLPDHIFRSTSKGKLCGERDKKILVTTRKGRSSTPRPS
jgi:hypothetical protein